MAFGDRGIGDVAVVVAAAAAAAAGRVAVAAAAAGPFAVVAAAAAPAAAGQVAVAAAAAGPFAVAAAAAPVVAVAAGGGPVVGAAAGPVVAAAAGPIVAVGPVVWTEDPSVVSDRRAAWQYYCRRLTSFFCHSLYSKLKGTNLKLMLKGRYEIYCIPCRHRPFFFFRCLQVPPDLSCIPLCCKTCAATMSKSRD